jgi:hypothetical protein
VGSFHTRLFGIVYVTCGDFHDGSEKVTASVHQILCQSTKTKTLAYEYALHLQDEDKQTLVGLNFNYSLLLLLLLLLLGARGGVVVEVLRYKP